MARFLCILLVLPLCYAGPSSIVYPCNPLTDECIRDNLAANSQCNRNVAGAAPSEYTIAAFPFETPYFNASYVDNNLIVRNLDKCEVSQFFYNVPNDNAVLAVSCANLEFESTRTLIQHAVAREDVTYSYDFRGIYPEIVLTVNLKPANKINLCRTKTFAYVSALPTFVIDPKNQKTANFLSTDLSFLNIFERESLEQRANQLLRYFVNQRLCNFGCDY